MSSNKLNKKAISPLIATILLIVVAVVIVTFILNWGKDFTFSSLNKTQVVQDKTLDGLILVDNAIEMYDNTFIILKNTSKDKTITITSYIIQSDNTNQYSVDKIVTLDENIILNENSTVKFPIYYFPNKRFDLQLITTENKYITVKVNVDKKNQDNFVLKDEILLDIPMQSPYTELGPNVITNGTFDTDSDWVKYSGWSISNGKLIGTNLEGYSKSTQTLSYSVLEVGKTYKVSLDVDTLNSGIFSFYMAGSGLPAQAENNINSTGTHTFYKTLDTVLSQSMAVRSFNGADGIIDNVEIRELDATAQDRSANQNNGSSYGATIDYDGLVNTSSGKSYISSDVAYGIWEFDLYKGVGNPRIHFITDNTSTYSDFSGYIIYIYPTGRLNFTRSNDGTGSLLFGTADNYIKDNIWYRFKIIRSTDNIFTIYIKGGEFGWQDWLLISTTGGSGTNPITNSNYTTSNYFLVDLDTGDKIRNLKINGKSVKLSNATQDIGSWTTTKPSFEFDGIDDFIKIDNLPNDFTGDVTISVWINPISWGESNGGRILDCEYLKFWIRSPTTSLGLQSDGSTSIYSGTGSISLNTWQHVLVTRTSSGITNFYVNGQQSGTANQNSGIPVAITDIIIGNNSETSRTFNGSISNLKIWNKILSENEINLIYSKEIDLYN